MSSTKQVFDYDGKIAGLYDLYETIGSGHFAVVKLARHVFTGEKVAVKVIDKNKLDPVSRAHLFQEVRCMKLVQHPHVVRLYEVIDTQTKLYLILELGDGGDMYDYIMKHDRGLDMDLARMYFRQIVEAISYCHNLHVVHRDLKPENVIFFEKLGVVKLTDFGFSNKYDPGTKLETSCGSLAYSAPEILLGDSYDAPAVDVWSLGVLLYMLVCGTPPFQEANDSETLTMIMDCKYHVPAHVPPGCKSLINKMLQREPSRRATLHEIVSDSWLSGDPGWKVVLPVVKDALVATQRLSVEDHDAVVERMVEGNIAPHHEIIRCLMEDEYNHVTATYYLLAERMLARRRQRELEAAANASGAATPVSSGSAAGGQPLMRQASVPGGMAASGSMAYRSHRLDHLSLTLSDTPRELGDASDAISALAVSPPGPSAVVSLIGCTTLPPRARKHSLIQEEDEECEENEGGGAGGAVSVFVVGNEDGGWGEHRREKEVDASVEPSATNRFEKGSTPVSNSSRGGSGTSSPRRRSATTPAASVSGSSVVSFVPPAPSRQLRTVCSSPQLLKPLAMTAGNLRQIYEDGEGTSASEGAADEDDDCPSLKFSCDRRPQRSADRRQTLPSPSTVRRLRLVRRKLQSDKKRAHSGSSDTSDTDDADRREAPTSGSIIPPSCRRKDSTSSGDTDGPGAGDSGGVSSGSQCTGQLLAAGTTTAESAPQSIHSAGSSQQRATDVMAGDSAAAAVLDMYTASSRFRDAQAPAGGKCPNPGFATQPLTSEQLLSLPLSQPHRFLLSREPSPPLPGRAGSLVGDDVFHASAPLMTAGGSYSAGRLAPISGCSTPEPVKASGNRGRGGCDCTSNCSRSSSCSTVNAKHFANKVVETSVSRMSNFSLASHVSSLSATSSKSSNGIRGGVEYSRSTPRLSRYGSKKFNKAKLIHVLAKEFSDLSETHSRTSIASLYLEDIGSSGVGVGASVAITCRGTDINENSILPAARLDSTLCPGTGVLTKRKSDASGDCCSVM